MQNVIAAMREILLTVFAWLLPVAVVACLVALSAERGVRPLRRLHRFICAFPPLERGLLAVFVSACVLWGALKPEGNEPPLNSPRRAPRMSLSGEAGGDGSPADFRIVDFHTTPSSVVVNAVWSADAFAAPPFVEWFVRTNLVGGAWESLGWVQADSGSTNVCVEIPDELLPDPDARAAFFAVCAEDALGPDDADDDGDGLSNGAEVSLGTNPHRRDTDEDGLPDGWEAQYGLDPLSNIGDDGAQGDFDGDGLLNSDEHLHGTNPVDPDTDGDGLSDLRELGGVTTNSLPWLEFESCTNLTAGCDRPNELLVTWPLPEPIYLHGVCVTEVTIDSNGLVYFIRRGGARVEWSQGNESMMTGSWTLNADSFTVAPYWDNLYLTTAEPASAVLAGTAVAGTNRCLMIQYDGGCPYENRLRQGETNAVSWQLVVPFGDAERMYVRYSGLQGTADGRGASIGFQDFGGVFKASYCHHEEGKVADGTAFAFAVGVGTDPLAADTRGDGSGDYAVYLSQVDPSNHDADGDGMPDRWEAAHGLDPLSTNGVDGAGGDYDGDGLSNWKEFACGSEPNNRYTFDAFVMDPVWVANGFCALPPTDCASVVASVGDPSGSHSEMWLMLVRDSTEGGRRFLVVCDEYGGVDTGTLSLERGRTYEGTLEHLGTAQMYPDYDWEARIDGRPVMPVLGLGIHSENDRWIVDHAKNVLIDNWHGLLGTCDQTFGSADYTLGKSFTITAVKTEIADGVHILPADCSARVVVALTADSTQLADWTIEPALVGGARLHADVSDHEGGCSLPEGAKVYVTAGSQPTNYVIRARHPMCTNSVAEIVFTVCRVDVTNVRFNHDTSSSETDGINLRSDFSTLGFSHDLGEWKTEMGEVEMNFPACYRGGVLPTVQAKFRVTPATVGTARIFARQRRTGSPLGGLLDTAVEFSSGVSGWVTFTETARVPSVVARDEAEFEWYVSEVGSRPVNLTSIDVTGPHRVYVVLADPVEPWSSDSTSDQCAWTNALELACGWASGASTLDMAATCVTRSIYESGKFRYDVESGDSCYTLKRSFFDRKRSIVHLSAAIERFMGLEGSGELVNCTDCASFVTSFSNLLGCELYSSRMGWNFMTNPYTAIGCAAWHPPDWGWGFSYHEVAWSGNGGNEDFIYDACLQYDGDENPNSWPKTAVLPAGVLFSDGDPESPLVYRERLTPPDENGYESCVALPSMRMRRSLK